MVWHFEDDDLILHCRVQPRASKDGFAGLMGQQLRIRLTAPPVDGKANAHLIEFLSREFGVSRRQVSIISGESSRQKRIRIHAPARLPDIEGLAPPARTH